MLTDRIIFRFFCGLGDMHIFTMKKPDDIERRTNIPYGKHGKWNELDVYFPKGTETPLPAIVSVHGGGYVYGTKNLYQYYCMNLAQRGFTVVNFNYRLAPGAAFPSPVIETNEVMKWICLNAADYYIDLNNIFFVGDSAGAQIASQYAAIVTNNEYAGMFGIVVPEFKLRAVALNCGMYEKFHELDTALPGLLCDYFGKDPLQHGEKTNVLKYINSSFPPAFIMSSANDFLLPCAKPMFEHLQKKGVPCVCEIYGIKEERKTAHASLRPANEKKFTTDAGEPRLAHVFHLDIRKDSARKCNDAQCEFFKKYTITMSA